jgi:hypothetical protein
MFSNPVKIGLVEYKFQDSSAHLRPASAKLRHKPPTPAESFIPHQDYVCHDAEPKMDERTC